MLNEIIRIAEEAGKKILDFYNSAIATYYKEDGSPVTKVDWVISELIIDKIAKISNYPIVSEEIYDFNVPRKHYENFWLVDPLDGTKDFLAKNGQFTVNIALIENGNPILGVVNVPVSGNIYYASKNRGAFKNGIGIYNYRNSAEIIGTDSCFHSTEKTQDFFRRHNITNIKKYGSAIKLCKIAEGEVDIYPRLNGTKEWDTAAGHIILNEAGGEIIDLVTNEEMIYDKESVKNNFFIAKRKGLIL
ncbi:MAG: 3'(2'),5'-bisphosphate nucleotidase CysQ [Holosporaceae bacterium]|jgi:3'(2'), 5'-bisphosphate nucleotidase|nr:3'(2'),5'-bisphosphate nucleotidase CysQ [Holosporaceae bacterium]